MIAVDRRELIPLIIAPAILIGFGIFLPESLLARLVSVFLILFFAQKVGGALIDEAHPIKQWLAGAIAIISLTVIIQTSFYYLDLPLRAFTDLISLALSLSLLSLFWLFARKELATDIKVTMPDKKSVMWFIGLLLPALIAFGFIMKAVISHGTLESIRTPWPFLPDGSFIAFAALSVIAWLVAKKTSSIFFTGISTTLSVLSVTLIAPFLYKLGYGFDGFLHRASQRVLLETGILHPKPLYYIGQYAFNTWISRLLNIDLMQLDKFLVPLGISCITVALFLVLKPTRRNAFSMSALPSILLLSPFVATTPQAFAYLTGLGALILAFGTHERRIHPILPILLALWSLAIHPLAGLPFIGAVGAILWANRQASLERSPLKSPILYLFILATIISVPCAFFIFSRQSGQIIWDFSHLWQIVSSFQNPLDLIPKNHVALWADWASEVAFFFPFALWGLSLYAVKSSESKNRFIPLLLIAAGTWLAGMALSTVGEFTFLINYERGNYSDRLTLISYLLLFFPALIGFGQLSERIIKRGSIAIALFLLGFAAWQAGYVYTALPRHDAAAASRGWSVGRYDFDAVRFIEQDAAGTPYTVLANQSVSAAAVETYGFARYTHNEKTGEDIFYYPIPTGGTLYELYLEAVASHPSIDAILEAGNLGNSNKIYVVLNQYWWDADRVAAYLSSAAEQTTSFGNGQVLVFRFSSQK